MKEYIEINKSTFPTPFTRNTSNYAQGWNTCLNAVLQHKVIDIAPVVHGKWLDIDTFDFHRVHIYQCSNCHREVADNYIDNHKFCLHCEAKMDGDEK